MMTLFHLLFCLLRQISLTDAVCNSLSQTRASFCSSHILQTFNRPSYYRSILATGKRTFSIWMIHTTSHCFWMAVFAYSCFKIIFLSKNFQFTEVFMTWSISPKSVVQLVPRRAWKVYPVLRVPHREWPHLHLPRVLLSNWCTPWQV